MKKISRRSFLAAAGVSAAALALTACGGSSSTAASTAAGSAAGSAASGDTIKVGVLGPMTGDVSVYGLAVINGATLYLEQVNANGGVNGKQLEVITMDEQGDATQAVTCFTKMCDQGITALVGDVTTTPTLALAAGAGGPARLAGGGRGSGAEQRIFEACSAPGAGPPLLRRGSAPERGAEKSRRPRRV